MGKFPRREHPTHLKARKNIVKKVLQSEKAFKSNLMLIEKLLMSVEQRVGNIFDHSSSVSTMVLVVAREMGIKDRKELINIQYGSFFHDIGKISIPNRILHKSSSLTKHEYTIMKTHTSFGHEMINVFPGFDRIANIVHQHHECWDGSGYPHKLKGKKIYLGARICAVVDSFEAMSAGRRYSSKKPLNMVLRELNKCSGIKYDPEVIEAFNKCFRTLAKILKEKQK